MNWVKKINGNLNKNINKIKEMSSSKGFGLSNNKSMSNSSAMFYNTINNNNNNNNSNNNNQSVFLDTKSTFYDFNKKKAQMNSSGHSSNNTINKI